MSLSAVYRSLITRRRRRRHHRYGRFYVNAMAAGEAESSLSYGSTGTHASIQGEAGKRILGAGGREDRGRECWRDGGRVVEGGS